MPIVGFAFTALLLATALTILLLPAPRRAAILSFARRPPVMVAALALAAGIGIASVSRDQDGSGVLPPSRPNIIVIMVDDLDVDLFTHLAAVARPDGAPSSIAAQLGSNGATFANAFVVDPLCCPSRSSLLRGQYAHNHGLWQNGPPDGGYEAFRKTVEPSTLAVWLQAAGYRTGLVGKYMNGYGDDLLPPLEDREPLTIPPGWDANSWRALWGTPSYTKFHMNQGGSLFGRSAEADDYQTVVLSRMAVNVINAPRDPRPFFLLIAPSAPHDGNAADDLGQERDGVAGTRQPKPAEAWDALYEGMTMPTSPAFLSADSEGKPEWVAAAARAWRGNRTQAQLAEQLRATYVERMEAMASVEELVAAVIDNLGPERMAQTYIFFTSDNGYHMGQHSLPPDKRTPYEEDIRVPLLVLGPGVPAGSVRDELVTNLDLTATILEIAGASAPLPQDGRSLLGLMRGGSDVAWRNLFMIEYQSAPGDQIPSWRGIRANEFKYIEWANGFVELYDLRLSDGAELENIAPREPDRVADFAARLEDLRTCVGLDCFASQSAGTDP